MIKNAAFGAALTVFLFAAWLAGELSFLAPYKTALFRRHAEVIGGGASASFSTSVRSTTRSRVGSFSGIPGANCCISIANGHPR